MEGFPAVGLPSRVLTMAMKIIGMMKTMSMIKTIQ
jgi:hypothetical protein